MKSFYTWCVAMIRLCPHKTWCRSVHGGGLSQNTYISSQNVWSCGLPKSSRAKGRDGPRPGLTKWPRWSWSWWVMTSLRRPPRSRSGEFTSVDATSAKHSRLVLAILAGFWPWAAEAVSKVEDVAESIDKE